MPNEQDEMKGGSAASPNVSLELLKARVFRMSKGNPGAINVMCRGIQMYGEAFLDRIEAKGLQGSQIWIAFMDICEGDLERMFNSLPVKPANEVPA